LSTSPFADEVPRAHAKDAHWVTPSLVGEVTFSEWTRDGRMRHPSWRGLRPDKDPQDVRRES
ncbi:MAG: bifunctional non-ous end joining protein LigD, partial [Actinomycetota bacterium]|nr:bifunctional non-ous end joining protein LigD [Actinomycetota bacterium]